MSFLCSKSPLESVLLSGSQWTAPGSSEWAQFSLGGSFREWLVLHFGTNHIVHKNLTFYFLSRSIFIIVLGQKRGSKPVRFSSSPHPIGERPDDIFFLCSNIWTRKKPGNRMVSGFIGAISYLDAQCGCGGRTRTYDLRVMSPTSFQLLYSAIWSVHFLSAISL